jgi:flagellar biosynthetic protein FliR
VQGALPIGWVFSSVLVSLRIAPVFALAPPFTFSQVPVMFRVLFGLGIAACLVASDPASTRLDDLEPGRLIAAGAGELMLGGIFVLAFQLMFAAIYVAGRTLDIQAGYGLALVIDPSSQAQTPMIGTLIAYGAAAVFFAMNGHAEVLGILRASLEAVPIGGGHLPATLGPLTSFISALFLAGFGVVGGAVLCLFLADLAIAMLSRTVPQMNVLILGLQVKSLLILLVLPITFGFAGALLARMARITLEAIPRLIGA